MKDKYLNIIRWSVFFLLTGKGILHFTSQPSYHLIFSNGRMLDYFFGMLLIVGGISSIMPLDKLKTTRWVYFFVIPSLIIGLQSFGNYIKAGYVIEQFVEHSLQIALPIIFILQLKIKAIHYGIVYNFLAAFVALTFIGHACFALGINYVPANFIEMTSESLGLSRREAVDFLFVIGVLDIVFAILVFIPFLKKYALVYLILWGFLTSFARTYYMLGDPFTIDILLVNIPNTVYRLCHGLIPLLLFLVLTEFKAVENRLIKRKKVGVS